MDLVDEIRRIFDVSADRAEGAIGVVFGAIRDLAPADLANEMMDAVPEAPGWIARAGAPPTGIESQAGLMLGNVGAEAMRFATAPVGVAAGVGGGGGTLGALRRFGFDPEAAGRLVPPVFRLLQLRLGPDEAERLSFSVPFLRRLGGGAR